jgi:hypothetical protein
MFKFHKNLIFILLLSSFYAEANELKLSAKLVNDVLTQIPTLPAAELCGPEIERKNIHVPAFVESLSHELTKKRALSPFMKSCFKGLNTYNPPKNFAEAISFSLELQDGPQENMLDEFILDSYGVKKSADETNPAGKKWDHNIGLSTHPMCRSIDEYFIRRNEKSKKDRIKNATPAMSYFVDRYNFLYFALQQAVIEKKSPNEVAEIKLKMREIYFALFSSIAMEESLGDADNSQQGEFSKFFAEKYDLGKKYVRPTGVKFYYDKEQSNEDSRYNVGLYQFTPRLGGNIDGCYFAWNNIMGKKHSDCKINLKNNTESFEHIAASDQVLNAFCGVNKYIQSLGIQVNAMSLTHPSAKVMQLTHKDNIKSGSTLKESKDRCITPFSHTRNSYMHFGVLGFTTYSNGLDGKPSSNTQKVLEIALEACCKVK